MVLEPLLRAHPLQYHRPHLLQPPATPLEVRAELPGESAAELFETCREAQVRRTDRIPRSGRQTQLARRGEEAQGGAALRDILDAQEVPARTGGEMPQEQ